LFASGVCGFVSPVFFDLLAATFGVVVRAVVLVTRALVVVLGPGRRLELPAVVEARH
jgi:hypothetical protein